MKQTLLDFSMSYDVLVMCDNTSAINLSKNPILYSYAKHIDIMLEFLCTKKQLANIFNKLLCDERFSMIGESLV